MAPLPLTMQVKSGTGPPEGRLGEPRGGKVPFSGSQWSFAEAEGVVHQSWVRVLRYRMDEGRDAPGRAVSIADLKPTSAGVSGIGSVFETGQIC